MSEIDKAIREVEDLRADVVLALKNEIYSGLEKSAYDFLNIGLDLFYTEERDYPFSKFQIAIANLSISIELMVKACITKNAFMFLYKGLPLELQMFLAYPDKTHNNVHNFAIDLRTFKYETVELNDAFSRFFQIFPEQKDVFKPYFEAIPRFRNLSVHAYLASFNKFHLNRVAYTALKLYDFMENKGFFEDFEASDTGFLSNYEDERTKRVEKAIEEAKKKAKGQKYRNTRAAERSHWKRYMVTCPICTSDGYQYGDTELRISEDIDGAPLFFLDFYSSTFKCDSCSFEASNWRELLDVGLERMYDRSDDVEYYLEEYR